MTRMKRGKYKTEPPDNLTPASLRPCNATSRYSYDTKACRGFTQ